jgi:hypothetical protein
LGNGIMKDLGIITYRDKVHVLDAKKIQREKKRVCAITVNEREPDLKSLTCIGLDGKKDSNVPILETKTNAEDGTQSFYKTTGSIHNLTFTAESGTIPVNCLNFIKYSITALSFCTFLTSCRKLKIS